MTKAPGIGQTEKTDLKGTAKNPRWLKACNITSRDICEFFFISIEDEIVVKAFAAQSYIKKAFLVQYYFI